MVYQKILLSLFFVGLLFIIIDMVKTYNKCPLNKTIYRFIPRTFREEQNNPVPLDDIFQDLFERPSPWVFSFDVHKSKKDINDNFISQGEYF